MLKKTVAGLGMCVLSLMTALPAGAQDVATVVLGNGERPSGQLVDMNASGYSLMINGQERQISAGDVASIEFVVGAPPAEAQAKIDAGQPFVWLRNGQIVDGRLTDIGGKSPLRLTVDTPSGQRQFMSNDVAQIYINPRGRGLSAAQSQAGAPAAVPAGAIAVAANQVWTNTGIVVARGQRYAFTATGDIKISDNASSGAGGSPAATVATSKYPVAGAPVGALIGRVGNGAPFLIGTNTEPIQVPGTGRLTLAVNDDHLPDNSGTFWVTVTRVQ